MHLVADYNHPYGKSFRVLHSQCCITIYVPDDPDIIGVTLMLASLSRRYCYVVAAFADEDAEKQVLDELNQSAAEGAYNPDRRVERQRP